MTFGSCGASESTDAIAVPDSSTPTAAWQRSTNARNSRDGVIAGVPAFYPAGAHESTTIVTKLQALERRSARALR